MKNTNKICWLKGSVLSNLLWAILLMVFVNCDWAEAGTLRLDTGFTPAFTDQFPGDFVYINDIREQQDGKILVAGWFDTVNGTSRRSIVRLNGNGSLDTTYTPGSGVDNELKKIAMQDDDRVILAGNFDTVNGAAQENLARLNLDGSLDTSFTAHADSPVWAMDISGGMITIGGQFSAVNNAGREDVARLKADGTLDSAFVPGAGVTSGGGSHWVRAVATIPIVDYLGVHTDKILVGGDFTSFNYFPCNRLVRLTSTGAVDTSFNIGSGFNDYSVVTSLAVQPDGNYLVGGTFTTFNGTIRSAIARLLSTGALDTSFNCSISGGYGEVDSIALQEDGRIVIGGNFTTVNGVARMNVARLNSDGSLDMDFNPGAGADATVKTVLSTRQGQVLLGGFFTSVNDEDRAHVARFNGDPNMAGGAANPYTVFAGGKDDWKQVNLPRPSVNTGTLDLLVEGTLYYLSTLGPPVFLRLTYNSNLHNPVAGGFGKRWSFLYESSITRQSFNQVRLRKGTGEQETYTTLTPLTSATPSTPITLNPVKGTFSQLICYGTYWLYKEKDTRFSYRFDSPDVNSPAFLTSISDRNSNTLTISTDPATSRVQKITDPAGREINLTYTPAGYCSRITVPDGRTIEFSYDGFGQLVQVKDMIGYLGKYAYDNGYITKTDLGDIGSTGGGQEMTFTYSDKTWGSGKYVSAIQSLSGKTLIGPVNNSLNQVRWTNPRGQVTTVQTENGKTSGVKDPSGALRSLSYVEGMLSNYTNGNGQSSTFTYDAMGNTTSVIDALGKTTSYSYDAQNNLTDRQDAQGHHTSYAYDGNGNLLRVNYPNTTQVSFSYSSMGQLESYTNALGKITGYAYDNYGNLTTMTAPDTGVVTYSYLSGDQYSRCYRITDTRGQQKSYSYDNNNRITRVSYGAVVPYVAQVSYSYDALDLLSVTDELGKTTRVERNDDSLIVKSVDPLNKTTQFQYDGNGNLTKQSNPLNQSIQTTYDAANHPVETTDPLNQTLKRTYDPDGNLISFRDARFKTTTFDYDANNRLKTIRNPLNQAITKTYDALGRETETQNSRGAKVIRQYDVIGNLTRKSYDASVQVDYTYDAANNLLSSTDVLGQKTYTYDDSGRVATITWPDAKSVSFTYDTEGNVTSVTYPGALLVSYSYDSFCRRKLPAEFRHGPRDDISPYPEKKNQATNISWTGGGSLAMQYDAAGNLLRETMSNGTESTYLYDGNRKVTAIEHRDSDSSFLTIANTYDAAGRRLSSIDSQTLNAPFPSSSDVISYDDANQLVSFGSTAFSYDNDGNVIATTGGSSSLVASYDTENRPLATTINGVTTTYSFDGEGHPYRIVKNGVTSWYHWDHGGRLLFITDNSGTVVTRFVYRGTRLLAQQDLNGSWYFYHFDTNGNTIALTNSTGTVVAQYAYSAHGQYASLGTPPYNPFTFVGQFGVLEQGSNIYLMTNRLYLASTGRFLQRDPLGLTGGVNLYVYAGNNPVGRIDPQGTFEVDPGDVGDSPEMENPRVSEGTADLDTNELPYHTDSSVDPETADALAKDFAGGIDAALDIYGTVPGLPQGNFINAARAARDGKYAKATWETCKGLIGCVPGPGTAINITIDTTELLLSNADGTSGGSAIGGVPTANYSNR